MTKKQLEVKLLELDGRLAKIEKQGHVFFQSFRRDFPATEFTPSDLSHWPEYTKQQIWFFEAEIRRWQIGRSTQPGFAICQFLPGIPLHPLLFLPTSMVVKILEAAVNRMRGTENAAPLIQQITDVRREIKQLKVVETPKLLTYKKL